MKRYNINVHECETKEEKLEKKIIKIINLTASHFFLF